MKTWHIGILLGSALLCIGAEAPAVRKPTAFLQDQPAASVRVCDRACLQGFADRYLEAVVAHDPSRLPLTKSVRFTENGQELPIGDALWGTASENASYRIYVTDPETSQVGFSGVIKENDNPALIAFRLKVTDGRVSEIEQIVARSSMGLFGAKNLTKPDPIFAEILAPAERSSRMEMIAIADSYFAALERMDGKKFVPFAETCNRLENGIQTTNNPQLGGASATGFSISALGCIDQFKTGYFKFVTEIRRRHLMVDQERGLVFSVAELDHAGNIRSVTLTDGRTVPINLSSPSSFLGAGFFKIKSGKLHRIYTTLITVPYGMKPGW